MVDMIDGCALRAPAADVLIAPHCFVDLSKAPCDDRCFGQRRGMAISITNSIGGGQHLDLEVKLLKPFHRPRALAIITSNGKGSHCRTLRQHYKAPYGTHRHTVPCLVFGRSVPLAAVPSAAVAAAPSSPWRPRCLPPLGLFPSTSSTRSGSLRSIGKLFGRVRRECERVASPWAGTACLPLAMRCWPWGGVKSRVVPVSGGAACASLID